MTEKTFHIMVGTKGQLIKMAPIMLEMDKQSIFIKFFCLKNINKLLSPIENVTNTSTYINIYYRFLVIMIDLIAKDDAN